MRKFKYLTLAQDDVSPQTITISEEDILRDYYPKWSERMKKQNKHDVINEENCLKDWITIHWAWEV